MKFQIPKRQALLYLICGVWAAIGSWGAIELLAVPAPAAISDTQPVRVLKNGYAEQGGSQAAAATFLDGSARFAFSIAPSELPGQITLDLPASLAGQNWRVDFDSIQGTDGMSAELAAPDRILLQMPQVVEESYTVATLVIPEKALSPSPFLLAQDWVADVTALQWLALAGVLAAITAASIWTIPPRKAKELLQLPPQVSAAEYSVMLNGGVQGSGLTACIFELASQGFLELYVNGPKLFFIRHQPNKLAAPRDQLLLDLLAPEDTVANSLDDVALRLNKRLFSPEVGRMYDEIYDELARYGWFAEDPRSTHLRMKTLGIALQLLALFTLICLYVEQSATLLPFSAFLYVQYLAGYFLYRQSGRRILYSDIGWQIRRYCLRIRESLIHPTEETPLTDNLFYENLPYAAASASMAQWTGHFRGSGFFVPHWLSLRDQDIVDPQNLADSMLLLADTISRQLNRVRDPNVD